MWQKRGGPSKYKAKRTADGFASQLESAVYALLLLREKAGEIANIERQVAIELTDAKIRCKIDFRFTTCVSGEPVFCEAKGFVTDRWSIIKRLWPHYAGYRLEIWGGSYRGPKLLETIEPEHLCPADL